ncbi:uncharacterized protein LOC135338765 isoform X4 [Halichondria panicea]|uniref:uncharacterized protein LOC135338765 isoform X4 n=1 Tax=Halichondria panicea TaxID=6063 RepID=UPI00312BA801
MESVATTTSWTIVLYVSVGQLLIATPIEALKFSIEPESVVQAEGLLAKFECLSPDAISHAWFVNDRPSTSSDFSSEIEVVRGTSGRPSVLTIPASSQFNNSVVQCAAFLLSGGVLSRSATLIVERVSIEVVNNETSITISVTNNFTMKTLTFRVHISLTTLGTNEMVALPPLNGGQNQVQFNYRQPDNHTVCDIFTFIVTPFSESGMEGRSSEPVTGFFTTVTDNNNVAPLISQGGNVLRKIVHLGDMVPNCTNFTSYQVNTDVLEPIRDPQVIYLSLPTDQIINISVTLTSITGVRLIFKDMLIRTTDVQNLSVDVCPKGNCARIEYVEGTLSPGALVCVIRITDGELDFQSMRLVPIRRNMSNNFTIPVAVSGNYSVVAFDLENNSMSVPRMPISVAADNETMFLSDKSSTEPSFPPNSEGITVTKLSNESTEVTCTTSGQSCLALFQSKTSPTSLNPMVMISLNEPPNDRTTVTLNTTSDVYVVVYTWNSDSGETIFDGKVSFISQLELPTSPPPTQSPPDTTGSPAPSPILMIVLIIIGAGILIVLVIAIFIVVGILYLVKRCKRRNYKVVHSSSNHRQFESNSQGRSTNRASPELGASITSQVAFYDVARPENMSLECITADTDDTLPPGYDVVRAENMPSPEYETVPLVQPAKPTFTSDNPPPLPPPMIRGDSSEASDLPPAYNPAVDNESVGVMSVESSISHGQSVDEEVDESVERDLSVSTVEHDGTTEEAIGSTEAQLDVDLVDTVRGAESGAGNNDHSEQEAMIAVQTLDNNGVLTEETTSTSQAKDERTEDEGDGGLETKITAQLVKHKPIDKLMMKDSSKVGYSKVDNDKLKPVVPPPALLPRQLPLLPTHETLMDLLHNVDNKWENIAKALNFDEDRVDEIFTNNENEYLRLYELMEYYFMNVHCSHSWEEMVRVLTEIGEHSLAERIKAEKIQDQDAHDADSYLKAVEANNCDESTQASVQGNESKAEPPTQDKKDTVETNNCDESTQASVQGNESKAEPPTQDKKDTVESNNCDESTQASVQGNESKAEPPTQDKKDTVETNNCDESTQASVQGNESKAEPPTQDKKDTVETNNCDESTQASVQGNESKAEPPTQDKKDTVETNNCDESTQASVQGNESKAEPPTQDKKDTVESNNCDESTQASVQGNESKAEPPTQDKKDTVETNNCDESTQASVRGNESKVVPPTQNDLSHPQVVDPLPIDKSNQSSVKEENDKNQLNVTKLGDTQLGHDRSMIVPPQPNYVTPSLL